MRKGVVIVPDDLNGVNWPEKMRELGLNTLGMHSGGGAAHDVLDVLKPVLNEDFRADLVKNQVDLEFELHAAHNLMPRKNFAEHPEYFIQPVRSSQRLAEGNWCCNADALAEVGKNAAALGKTLSPSTHRHFFWGEDTARGSWCHCRDCAGLSDSDQSLMAVNAMAEALRKEDPAAQVAYLAYCSLLTPPREVKPAEGVFLEFAPIERCFRHAIDDPACAQNRIQWQSLLKLLEIFPEEQVHVLEYWMDSSLFSSWQKPAKNPWVSREVIFADVAAYRKLGINSITSFAVYMDGAFFAAHGDGKLCEFAEALAAVE